MTGSIFVQPQLERLKAAILEQNKPGAIEGLLAFHVLASEKLFPVDWQVLCYGHWMERYNPKDLYHVAALGYSMRHEFRQEHLSDLKDGLNNIMRRDPSSGGHLSIADQPSVMLGISLGVVSLGDHGHDLKTWRKQLIQVVEKRSKGTEGEADSLYGYMNYLLGGIKIALQLPTDVDACVDAYKLAFAEWTVRRGLTAKAIDRQSLQAIRRRLTHLVATNLQFQNAYQAAFIWSATSASVFHALRSEVVSPAHVAAILSRFEDALRRWRWDEEKVKRPVRWPISGEREVQDIVWIVLRSYFDDLVDEDPLPKVGHSSYKPDFGIPSLRLIIEVKFASSANDFKKIEKGIMEDSVAYLQKSELYEKILVFIYDTSSSVQEHGVTRQDLKHIPGIADVVIVSRPSQLPG